MSEAHDEMRKRLTAYRDAKALYESPDPYDREEARYDAMHAGDAQKLATILAILRAAVASGDARARVLADVEEVARG